MHFSQNVCQFNGFYVNSKTKHHQARLNRRRENSILNKRPIKNDLMSNLIVKLIRVLKEIRVI